MPAAATRASAPLGECEHSRRVTVAAAVVIAGTGWRIVLSIASGKVAMNVAPWPGPRLEGRSEKKRGG